MPEALPSLLATFDRVEDTDLKQSAGLVRQHVKNQGGKINAQEIQ